MWTMLRGSLLLMLFADEASRLLDEAILALVVVLQPPRDMLSQTPQYMPLDFATTISPCPTFLYSRGVIPAIVKRSAISSPLIRQSRGDSQARDGERLTSRSQGLSQLSIRMSKPNNSKQLLRKGTYCSQALNITFSADNIVFIITSSIFLNIAPSSMPYSLKAFLSAYRDHFEPTPSALGSVFAIKFGLNLLREQFVR